MPVLPPSNFLSRLAPAKAQPQTGIEAYKQGGLTGLAKAAVTAPGTEIGPSPLAVVTPLPAVARGMFRTQAIPQMVRTGLDRVKTAVTGKPINLPAFRAESGAAIAPGRGVFYGLAPREAQRYAKGVRAGQGISKSAFKSANPLVVDGDQFDALGSMLKDAKGPVKKRLLKARKVLMGAIERADLADSQEEVEQLAKHVDRALAYAARSKGYDAIIYRAGTDTELVDLGKKVVK